MIWVTQWLCPSRHCVIAVAWDDNEMTPEDAEEQGEQAFSRGMVKRWCGICGQSLHVERGRTSFKTMDEAKPRLQAIESANLRARVLLGGKF